MDHVKPNRPLNTNAPKGEPKEVGPAKGGRLKAVRSIIAGGPAAVASAIFGWLIGARAKRPQ
jgi:hypothetical protein